MVATRSLFIITDELDRKESTPPVVIVMLRIIIILERLWLREDHRVSVMRAVIVLFVSRE